MWVYKWKHCPNMQFREIICFLWVRSTSQTGLHRPLWADLVSTIAMKQTILSTTVKITIIYYFSYLTGGLQHHTTNDKNIGKSEELGVKYILPQGQGHYQGSACLDNILNFYFQFSEKINNVITVKGLECLYFSYLFNVFQWIVTIIDYMFVINFYSQRSMQTVKCIVYEFQ